MQEEAAPVGRKTAVLSAEELFHWRKKEILPVPQRGGIKDFEPDGSWLEDKRLETYLEEHLSVLAEPRVEKSGNLVKGTWDSEMKLVNIEKTAKFWMKMGFTDSDRNWLHPEEALFLMEVNCLDLIHYGVSLSLQEAYSLLLHPSSNVSEEEYQVFAHLRRLGYIVLRHAGKLDITDYEMKIGLHNYNKKKNKKRSAKSKAQSQSQASCSHADSTAATKQREENKSCVASNPGDGQDFSSCGKNINGKRGAGMCPTGSADSTKDTRHSKNNIKNEECGNIFEHNPGEAHETHSEERRRDGENCERLSESNHGGSSRCQGLYEERSNKDEKVPECIQSTRPVGKRSDNTEGDSNSDTSQREPSKKKVKLDSDSNSDASLREPSKKDVKLDSDLNSDTSQREPSKKDVKLDSDLNSDTSQREPSTKDVKMDSDLNSDTSQREPSKKDVKLDSDLNSDTSQREPSKKDVKLDSDLNSDASQREPPMKKAKLDSDSNSDASLREPSKKKAKLDSGSESSKPPSAQQEEEFPFSSNPWTEATERSFAGPSDLKPTEWDFSAVRFPDIGDRDTVWLARPSSDCLPPNTCIDEEYEDICMFDVEEYRRQQQQQTYYYMDQEDNKGHLRQLDFSYAEWHKKNFHPVAARNWREWKEGCRQREKSFLIDSPVAHLWQGEVTPLVQPIHAQSTNAILKRLAVIQQYKGPIPAKEKKEVINISFDVYLPNTNFKKSSPGLPDHRVCVARGPQPPDVFDVHAVTAHLADRAPLHWAVVSSGDIGFFVFDHMELPVHPSSLG
ncbi:hypothetical protein ACOMHN_049482 [Nucella lapillus]